MRPVAILKFVVVFSAVLFGFGVFPCAASAVPAIWDRSLPDLDLGRPAMLDATTGDFAQAPRPSAFSEEAEYIAALSALGDLAYEDANSGLLFVGSGSVTSLGVDVPNPELLNSVVGRPLDSRSFLRGSELAAGAWFVAHTRSGKLLLGRITSRSPSEIRLRWSILADPSQRFSAETVEEIASVSVDRLTSIQIPLLGEADPSVLRFRDGALAAGPRFEKPYSAKLLKGVVEQVRAAGDLGYFRPGSGMLVVGSGRSARLGVGSVASLAGRDLSSRLRDLSLIESLSLTPGAVFLIETTSGAHVILRIDSTDPDGLSVTWLMRSDGSATFPDLAGFDALYRVPDQRQLDELLLTATSRGNSVETDRLLRLGADANSTAGRDRRPALVHGVINGDRRTVELLLANGANPNGQGRLGWSALHVAAKLGRDPLAEMLIKSGADPSAQTVDGMSALNIALAATQPNLRVIELLREAGGQFDDLTLAARMGDIETLNRLLERDSSASRMKEDGLSALHAAAAAGQSAAVRVLLEAGADPSLESANEESALLMAARANDVDTVSALLEHSAITSTQKSAALYASNQNGNPELTRRILAAGADAKRAQERQPSPLDHALRYGSEELLDVYIAAGHPLTIEAAARLGRIEELKTLLDEGEEMNPFAANLDGTSPIHLAIENDQTAAVEVLLDHGVDPAAALPTWDNRSPLHLAAGRSNARSVELLLSRGADPNSADRVGRTPLYDAVSLGRVRTVRLLLEHGADPNLAPTGEAVLDIARTETIRKLLVDYGAQSLKE